MFPGFYEAFSKIKGRIFVGSGPSHTEAMESAFQKINWFFETGNHIIAQMQTVAIEEE